MSQPLAFLNGAYIPQADARLSIHDAGLVWGATVTDRCRTFRHQLYRLADHLRRFRRSCQLARIRQPLADSELAEIAHHLVAENARGLAADDDLALVLFATPGIAAAPQSQTAPTLCVYTMPLPLAEFADLFRNGARLVTPTARHVPPECVSPTIKHRSRLHWWIAEHEVSITEEGCHTLLLDGQGHVTETATSNFMIVRHGHVLTPRSGSVLPGISLRLVSEFCHDLGIPFAETDLTLRECGRAEEAMLSCTSYSLAPVAQLNETRYTCPGPVFERLLATWSEHVGMDIRRQALAHASS
jgi:branched-subunit amino acid aminotransferase/4-amino-4-deoxychorismate lyase